MRLEFDANNLMLARILGDALVRYAQATTETLTDVSHPDPAGPEMNGAGKHPGVIVVPTDKQEVGGTGPLSNSYPAVVEPASRQVEAQRAVDGDRNGVAANYDYCSKAAKPFYASGAKEGQWKAKGGLPAGTYDTWYAGELKRVGVLAPDTTQDFNAAAALGTTTEPEVIDKPGELLKWIAEHQAAKRLTPEQITAAYRQTEITMTSLFIDEGAAATLHKAILPMLGAE